MRGRPQAGHSRTLGTWQMKFAARLMLKIGKADCAWSKLAAHSPLRQHRQQQTLHITTSSSGSGSSLHRDHILAAPAVALPCTLPRPQQDCGLLLHGPLVGPQRHYTLGRTAWVHSPHWHASCVTKGETMVQGVCSGHFVHCQHQSQLCSTLVGLCTYLFTLFSPPLLACAGNLGTSTHPALLRPRVTFLLPPLYVSN